MRHMRQTTIAVVACACLVGCAHQTKTLNDYGGDVRLLSQQSGRKPLFDGKTMNGWRSFEADTVIGWHAADGEIVKDRRARDLMTKDQYANFELEIEWKIGKGGNSGLFYRGTKEYDHIYWSAPEYQ